MYCIQSRYPGGHHDNHEAKSIVGSSKRELDIPTVTVSSEKLHSTEAKLNKTLAPERIKFCVVLFVDVVSDINFHHPTWTGSLPSQTSSAKNNETCLLQ